MSKSFIKFIAVLCLIIYTLEINAKNIDAGNHVFNDTNAIEETSKVKDIEEKTSKVKDNEEQTDVNDEMLISGDFNAVGDNIYEDIISNHKDDNNPIIPRESNKSAKVEVTTYSTVTTTPTHTITITTKISSISTSTSTSTTRTEATHEKATPTEEEEIITSVPGSGFLNTKPDENKFEDESNTSKIIENNGNSGTIDYNKVSIDANYNGSENGLGNKNESEPSLYKYVTLLVTVGAVSIGLVAVSSYKVLKRKSEMKSLKSSECYSSPTPASLMVASDYNNSRVSLVNSLLNEGQQEGNLMYYSAKNDINRIETNMINGDQPIITIEPNELPYRMSIQSEGSSSDKSRSIISANRNSINRASIISKNSVIRHSFLNPNLKIVRTGKRTQQLYEATNEHPAIIETFPSLERPFVPSVPVPLEESDINSLHPHSIYQMYQDEMEFENYYAYTIDDKEYIIDPTTNRVLEIHDLITDEYMLVEEELYLDFSGSSDDSDSDKQTIW